jgi:hypothetical protein
VCRATAGQGARAPESASRVQRLGWGQVAGSACLAVRAACRAGLVVSYRRHGAPARICSLFYASPGCKRLKRWCCVRCPSKRPFPPRIAAAPRPDNLSGRSGPHRSSPPPRPALLLLTQSSRTGVQSRRVEARRGVTAMRRRPDGGDDGSRDRPPGGNFIGTKDDRSPASPALQNAGRWTLRLHCPLHGGRRVSRTRASTAKYMSPRSAAGVGRRPRQRGVPAVGAGRVCVSRVDRDGSG